MGVNIRGRSFLTLLDYSPAEIRYLPAEREVEHGCGRG